MKEPFDKVFLILLGSVFSCIALLFAADIWLPQDQQMFTLISGLVSGFSGAALVRIKPKDQAPSLTLSDKSTVDVQATVHQDPKDPPKV